MSDHARLSPSAAKRWINCPFSASVVHPEKPPTVHTIKGHKLHERAARLLKGRAKRRKDEDATVKAYVNFVSCRAPRNTLAIEQKLYSLSVPELFGTPDALFIDDGPFKALSIVDLKTGNGRVDVQNNEQLKTYAFLAYENYGPQDIYSLAIAQYGRVASADYSQRQIDMHGNNIKWAAENPHVIQSGEHCQYCPLLSTCKEGRNYAVANGKSWSYSAIVT